MRLQRGSVCVKRNQILTPREKELLSYVIEDHFVTGKELSTKMNVSLKTVKYFIGNINKKLGTKDRRDLVQYILSAP